ncbi:MAG: hypothetical protein LBC63_00975 [Holophagales bacterium]|jgi:hypothetical protein|nr:hypothetical protein [Holophagales bacterium]
MIQNSDTSWQRLGTSWIWDNEARNKVCAAEEAWSLWRFLAAAKHNDWPELPPSNNNKTLVVAGLDAGLDLLSLTEAGDWLRFEYKHALLEYQKQYGNDRALVFWLPTPQRVPPRLKVMDNDDVIWTPTDRQCQASGSNANIDFGHKLWGSPSDYPQEILLESGGKPVGLHYRRFS